MKVAYWPGCVSRGFTPELHGSMAKVAPLLDIELVELDRACCTGAGVIAEHNQELADTLNARTFALAQQVDGAELMMNICSTCQGAQSECQERLDANAEYRSHVNETLAAEGLSYELGLTNKNFLWLLVEDIGLDTLRAKVKRPRQSIWERNLKMPRLRRPDAPVKLVGLRVGSTQLAAAHVASGARAFVYLFDWESPARGGELVDRRRERSDGAHARPAESRRARVIRQGDDVPRSRVERGRGRIAAQEGLTSAPLS